MVAPGCSGGKAGHEFVANGPAVIRHLINMGLISPQYGGCAVVTPTQSVTSTVVISIETRPARGAICPLMLMGVPSAAAQG